MDTVEQKIHPLHTACKECVFAVYGDKTQTGCRLGRLEKYRERGQVVEAMDNDLEFEIVNGTSCHFYRDRRTDWAGQYADDPAGRARQEVTLRFDCVVVLGHCSSLEELGKTLDGLRGQVLRPVGVYVVHNNDAFGIAAAHAFMVKNGHGLNWTLTDVIRRDNNGERLRQQDCVDEVFGKFRGHFYVVVPPGHQLPETFLLNVDRAVNDEMERFGVLLPTAEVPVMLVQHSFHRSFDGNVPGYAEDETTKWHFGDLVDKASYFAAAHPNFAKSVTCYHS